MKSGLYRKFRVGRVDGRDNIGGDRENAEYFVLDYVNDKYARVALHAYIQSCREEYPELARDLEERLSIYTAHNDPPYRSISTNEDSADAE